MHNQSDETTVLSSLVDLGHVIHQLNRKTEKILGLSLAQWQVLNKLVHLPNISALELAIEIGIHPSTLTQSLRRLTRKGYVLTAADTRDERRKIISITRAGNMRLVELNAKLKIALQSVPFSKEQLQSLVDHLGRVSTTQ